jgi:hypothetical protein
LTSPLLRTLFHSVIGKSSAQHSSKLCSLLFGQAPPCPLPMFPSYPIFRIVQHRHPQVLWTTKVFICHVL